PFDTIHCDCVGPFEKTKDGYEHVLLIVDAFTKYVQLVPLKSLSGTETLQVFKKKLTLFGTPRVIVLNRGTNFTFKSLEQFIKKHGIELHYNVMGAPRANRQAERYVATVTNLLTVEINKNRDWPSKLAKIMLTLNTTVLRPGFRLRNATKLLSLFRPDGTENNLCLPHSTYVCV
ncbi:Pro-Pol polyprotein, partial [Habropoda laboriosa]